jgi:hypothetical protein
MPHGWQQAIEDFSGWKSNMKCTPSMKCPVVMLYPSSTRIMTNSNGIMIRRLRSSPATTPLAITTADNSMKIVCQSVTPRIGDHIAEVSAHLIRRHTLKSPRPISMM